MGELATDATIKHLEGSLSYWTEKESRLLAEVKRARANIRAHKCRIFTAKTGIEEGDRVQVKGSAKAWANDQGGRVSIDTSFPEARAFIVFDDRGTPGDRRPPLILEAEQCFILEVLPAEDGENAKEVENG